LFRFDPIIIMQGSTYFLYFMEGSLITDISGDKNFGSEEVISVLREIRNFLWLCYPLCANWGNLRLTFFLWICFFHTLPPSSPVSI